MSDSTQPASYPLRIAPETRAKLEALAKASGRSLNTEIAMRLSASLDDNFEPPSYGGQQDSLIHVIREIAGEIAEQKFTEFFGAIIQKLNQPMDNQRRQGIKEQAQVIMLNLKQKRA